MKLSTLALFSILLLACGGALAPEDDAAPDHAAPDASVDAIVDHPMTMDVSTPIEASPDAKKNMCPIAGAVCAPTTFSPCDGPAARWECLCTDGGLCAWQSVPVSGCTGPVC